MAGLGFGISVINSAPFLAPVVGPMIGLSTAGPVAGGAFAAAQSGLAAGSIIAGSEMAIAQGIVMTSAAMSATPFILVGAVGMGAAGVMYYRNRNVCSVQEPDSDTCEVRSVLYGLVQEVEDSDCSDGDIVASVLNNIASAIEDRHNSDTAEDTPAFPRLARAKAAVVGYAEAAAPYLETTYDSAKAQWTATSDASTAFIATAKVRVAETVKTATPYIEASKAKLTVAREASAPYVAAASAKVAQAYETTAVYVKGTAVTVKSNLSSSSEVVAPYVASTKDWVVESAAPYVANTRAWIARAISREHLKAE